MFHLTVLQFTTHLNTIGNIRADLMEGSAWEGVELMIYEFLPIIIIIIIIIIMQLTLLLLIMLHSSNHLGAYHLIDIVQNSLIR